MIPSKRHRFWAERQFGQGVGTALVLFGAWFLWQGSTSLAVRTMLGVGLSLAALGFVYPRALILPNRLWTRLAEGLSVVSTRVILGLVFFLAVTPTGVVKRLTGWDPLGRRRSPRESYWVPYPERQHDPKHFEKMF